MKLRMLRLMQANLESSSAGTTPAAGGTVSSAPTDLLGNPQSEDGETASTVESAEAGATDWEDMMQDEDESSVAVVEKPAAEKPAVVVPATEAKPAVVEAKPAVVVPDGSVEVKPAVVAAEVKPAEAKPAPVVEKTPEQIAADKVEYEKQQKTVFEGLVKSYELPEDMALKLSTEPENVLPYLAARVHQNLAAQLSLAMERFVPQFFQSYQQSSTLESAARTAFETRWPELKGMDKEILETGALFRRLNPTAPAAEAIERIGTIVMQAKGLQVKAPAAGVAAVLAPAPKTAAPFKPAGGGASSSSAAPSHDANEFTQMAEEFLQDGS